MDARYSFASPTFYYRQRPLGGNGGGSGGGGSLLGLHGGAAPPSATWPLPIPAANVAVPSSDIGPGALQVGVSPPAASSDADNLGADLLLGMSQGEQVKKKRGRPRKYGPEGKPLLPRSPRSGSPERRRGRGRPPGTGIRQQFAGLGHLLSGSTGSGFTPHIITVEEGEDIPSKIMSFSQLMPRDVCILSAHGALSIVTLCYSEGLHGQVTYEGHFEIVSLSGSYLRDDNGGRSGVLAISISSPHGCIIGGRVGGVLKAATPVQVFASSFNRVGSKARNKNKPNDESGVQPSINLNTSSGIVSD